MGESAVCNVTLCFNLLTELKSLLGLCKQSCQAWITCVLTCPDQLFLYTETMAGWGEEVAGSVILNSVSFSASPMLYQHFLSNPSPSSKFISIDCVFIDNRTVLVSFKST